MAFKSWISMGLTTAMLAFAAQAHADAEYYLTLQNHQFVPHELTVPVNQKIKITIHNMDSTPAQFQSISLNREKLIQAESESIILTSPLRPGKYTFFDDFHSITATGVIIAK